ncbi:hypothetical protein [Streptomyces sp. NPDC090056]|uniref:hypothetical protein n=1 Tax=Streptomyces sp. NPDC090056 TaxID=3365934 RepID=UPI0037F4F7E4
MRYRVVAKRSDDRHPGAATLTHWTEASSIEEAISQVRAAHEGPTGVYGQGLYRIAEVHEGAPR